MTVLRFDLRAHGDRCSTNLTIRGETGDDLEVYMYLQSEN